MAESLTEVEIKGFDEAGFQFDNLVEDKLNGEQVEVVIEWEDQLDEHGENDPIPRVSVNGIPAQQYSRTQMEWVSADEELITETACRFEEFIAMMWDDTIRYYGDLETLAPIMDNLAVSQTTGYRETAVEEFIEQGVERPITDDVTKRARKLACAAFQLFVESEEHPVG